MLSLHRFRFCKQIFNPTHEKFSPKCMGCHGIAVREGVRLRNLGLVVVGGKGRTRLGVRIKGKVSCKETESGSNRNRSNLLPKTDLIYSSPSFFLMHNITCAPSRIQPRHSHRTEAMQLKNSKTNRQKLLKTTKIESWQRANSVFVGPDDNRDTVAATTVVQNVTRTRNSKRTRR